MRTQHARTSRWRKIGIAGAFIAAQGVALGLTGSSVSALTEYTVTTTADEFDLGATVAAPGGDGLSIREAVALANNDADDSVINLADGATYQLDICIESNAVIAGDDLDHVPGGVSEALTINGNGSTIEQTCESRVLRHDSQGTLTLDDVTITGGIIEGEGGGIASYGPAVVQNGSRIVGNLALAGGGIYASAPVTITGGSEVSDNNAAYAGGGIYSGSAVQGIRAVPEEVALPFSGVFVTDSTIDGNCAGASTNGDNAEIEAVVVTGCDGFPASGGGIFSQGPVSVTGSAITDNTATGNGGGIYQGYDFNGNLRPVNAMRAAPAGVDEPLPTVTVTNSTISGNDAASSVLVDGDALVEIAVPPGGGGIWTTNMLELTNATVAANTSMAGPANLVAIDLDSFGSVFAYPGENDNCWTLSTTDTGFNYSTDDSCGLAGTGSTESGSDPMLAPLALNGGTTENHLPDLDSNLVDGIPTASCSVGPDDDQRDIARPQGQGCDIGAVEVPSQLVSVDVVVDNSDGGTASGADFTIEVYDSEGLLIASGTDPEPGTGNKPAEFILPVGDYTFGVSGPTGYEVSLTISVVAPTEMIDDPSAEFSVAAGDEIEAVMTLDDIAPPTTTTTTTTSIPAILPPTGSSDGTGVLALIAGLFVLLGTGAAFATRRR